MARARIPFNNNSPLVSLTLPPGCSPIGMARVVYIDVIGSASLKLTLKKDVPARKVWASLCEL